MEKSILVTGGSGFIGSNFILQWIEQERSPVVNLDKLTYAGNPRNLISISSDPRYGFAQGDICDRERVRELLQRHQPRAVVHFAAESHVDRSIKGPDDFIRTNVHGTFCLLEEVRAYYAELTPPERNLFRILHISTDEVYGSLGPDDSPFCETTAYAPNSPYSATKAGADHLVRAYHHTYGLPTLTTNCSNNYGPFQFPEKLIPLVVLNARAGKPLPVYGDGMNVRDWLFVEDHCRAIRRVLARGKPGETYNIGGHNEQKNLTVVQTICALLEELAPERKPKGLRYFRDLVAFVADRPGHDARYATDATKIARQLNWRPKETFESGLRKTVQWYLENEAWWQHTLTGEYRLARIGQPASRGETSPA